MWLGRYTLRTPAPPAEVLRRLERLLRPVTTAALGVGGPGRATAAVGRADGDGFVLRRLRASGRPSFLRARGTVEPWGGGTRVRVSLGLAGARPWVYVLLLAAAGAAVGRAGLEGFRTGGLDARALSWLLVYPVALGFALLALAAERGRLRRLLGYLTGEMTSNGLAHELAQVRDG